MCRIWILSEIYIHLQSGPSMMSWVDPHPTAEMGMDRLDSKFECNYCQAVFEFYLKKLLINFVFIKR